MFLHSEFNGFKLIELEIKNDKIFGNIVYNFVEEGDLQTEIYITVIIGPNGTMKSLLFKRVIQLFWDIHTLKANSRHRIKYDYGFRLTYSLDNLIYEYTNIHPFINESTRIGDQYLKINGISDIDDNFSHKFTNAQIPDSIIANAIMITDKFPFPKPVEFPQYKYLGSRYRPQLASTSSYINRTVEFISNSIDNNYFLEGINLVVKEFFNSEYDPYIVFYTQNTTFFFGKNITVGAFDGYFEDIDKKYASKTTIPPFKLNYYKSKIKGNSELIDKIVGYCKMLLEDGKLRGFPRSSMKAISFKLNESTDLEQLKNDIELLNHMKSLGMIHAPEFEFLKPDQSNRKSHLSGYSIFESSSGEHNLLGSLVGLMASIKPSSLIFIDEPEVSLHPNWQMRYLNIIRELFANPYYSKSHLIVATHSHFILSDLKGDNSKIIGLTRDPNLKIVDFPKNMDTFGWSAEEVLYRLFRVRTTRNYFFEYDISKMISMVTNGSKEKGEIQKIVDKLEGFKFSAEDPLTILLEKAKEYIRSLDVKTQ